MRILLIICFLGLLSRHLCAQSCQFPGSDSARRAAIDREITRERAEQALAILEGQIQALRAAPDSARRVGWEFLNIGAPNQLNYLRGYLLKQDVQFRDAELQRLSVANGPGSSSSVIDGARAALQDARTKYCTFVTNAIWPD